MIISAKLAVNTRVFGIVASAVEGRSIICRVSLTITVKFSDYIESFIAILR